VGVKVDPIDAVLWGGNYLINHLTGGLAVDKKQLYQANTLTNQWSDVLLSR